MKKGIYLNIFVCFLVSVEKRSLCSQSGCMLDPNLHICLSVTESAGEYFFPQESMYLLFYLLFFSTVESLLLVCLWWWGFAERSSPGKVSCAPAHLEKHATGARNKLFITCSYLCSANPLCAFVS